jgi:hypothetical protein
MEHPNGVELNPWFDLPHAFLERRIFDVVNGFDRFFADDRDLESLRSSTSLRWRNELRIADDGSLSFGTTLRGDVTLPYLQKRLKRLRIVLEDAGRSLGDSEPAALTGQRISDRGDALLRWTLLDTLRSSIDLGGGVLVQLPPGLIGKARFRYARELGSVALARASTTGFWTTRDGFGFKASLAFERSLARRLLLRWTTGTLLSQASTNGYASGSEVALLATLGRAMAVTLLGSAAIQSKPDVVVNTWRVAARVRQAFFRRWIYGEVEPELRWPLDATGARNPTPAIFFRIEIQFEDEPAPAQRGARPPADGARAAPSRIVDGPVES